MTAEPTDLGALVTGATSGIGRATAAELASIGVHVILSGRDSPRGEAAVAAIRADGGKADFLRADLYDAASARGLAADAVELAGHIDILVNNAGVMGPNPTDPHQAEAVFDKFYAVNVKVPYFLVDELAPAMAGRGHGAIVNVTSMAAQLGMVPLALYGSTKAALVLLTKSWAAQYGGSGVRVNAVSPGPTSTEGTARLSERHHQLAAAAPAGRPAQPAEIAAAIAYLVSERASFIQGVILPVDGGRLAV